MQIEELGKIINTLEQQIDRLKVLKTKLENSPITIYTGEAIQKENPKNLNNIKFATQFTDTTDLLPDVEPWQWHNPNF